jgi:hypothetical protein
MECVIGEHGGLFHRSKFHRPHSLLISSVIDHLIMQQGEYDFSKLTRLPFSEGKGLKNFLIPRSRSTTYIKISKI